MNILGVLLLPEIPFELTEAQLYVGNFTRANAAVVGLKECVLAFDVVEGGEQWWALLFVVRMHIFLMLVVGLVIKNAINLNFISTLKSVHFGYWWLFI